MRRYARALRLHCCATLPTNRHSQCDRLACTAAAALTRSQSTLVNSSPQTVSATTSDFNSAACNESLQTSSLSQCTVVFLPLSHPCAPPARRFFGARQFRIAFWCRRCVLAIASDRFRHPSNNFRMIIVCVFVCVHASLKPIECRLG